MADNTSQLGVWQPWNPHEVSNCFSALTIPWWIAGGWALDLFIGGQTREHDDIDVQVLRRDQQTVRTLFGTWDVEAAQPAVRPNAWPFCEWQPGMYLSPEIHDVWCRPKKTAPWALQLMIADTRDEDWIFRRDARIYRAISAIGHRTADGIPYLAPEIQLLYKAKVPRPKDEADFARTLPHLNRERRAWLAQALAIVHPGHPWLLALEGNER
ncbi:MAG TPA: aminoglycoside adenylyltransferase [Ktedonobacteraceae bacterium]